ncbi:MULTISPECIES: undecaprenyl-diphosphate phosphatase [Pseudomonas]|uniref:Undecaprenyl-diphosphatase n=1 Tax=Pseudomonas luteola TaxID=47886 RepID=A0A2X2DBR7_PSELU|nr:MULTISPECIES: undecaprenyl-diphosphate phosphatase [Pseudomonas]ENA28468.1 undecaprenyl-diphosphatase UppP [Pseudomonas sp. HPB0071]MBF8641386.1 undecaprenyl-diphosphate phosphatase [Pseudomonas zeshuii]RRW50043.1 undecaprenyl-diphosphate phosphatase [Pseudomonas luteola]SHJ00552.1 undecaprenyl-diphosphatase [Pseudomonas zeshuii]SPZ16443.1 UDP-diphosphatase [Pseudomonas luteola]
MEWFHVLILSLIQGITEFLPVSSSAHLILPSQLFGWPDQGLAFDVAVHVGTLLAVVLAFRHEVLATAMGWTRQVVTRQSSPESRLGWAIIIGTIPAALAGLMLEHYIESYARAALVIATSTIVFGLILWWADAKGSRTRDMDSLSWQSALVIGLAQALALIPGTSRSGITMTAALLLGFTRQAAARFSFLLSIPLILAAGGLKTVELIQTGTDAQWVDIAWGVGLSFISALLCIKLFLKALDKIGMLPFVIYRLALGAVLFALFI